MTQEVETVSDTGDLSLPSGIMDWVARIDPEVVQKIAYGFAKRHGVVAAFQEKRAPKFSGR